MKHKFYKFSLYLREFIQRGSFPFSTGRGFGAKFTHFGNGTILSSVENTRKITFFLLLSLSLFGCREHFNDIYIDKKLEAEGTSKEPEIAEVVPAQDDKNTAGAAGQGGTNTLGRNSPQESAALCESADTRCVGVVLETCVEQQWKAAETPCRWGCKEGACETPAELSANDDTTYLRMSSGSVWAWGDNSKGQLGIGSTDESSSIPVLVTALPPVKQIAAHAKNTCALTYEGEIFCWGDNKQGIFVSGEQVVRSPKLIPALSQVEEIAVGDEHACIRNIAGEIFCWGDGHHGQLGQGERESSLTPVQVVGITKAQQLALRKDQSCALGVNGEVACWGLWDEQLASVPEELIPKILPEVEMAKAIYLGDSFGCSQSTIVQCWGKSDKHQIGEETFFEENPKPLSELLDVVEMALGAEHGCAILGDGSVRCWGANDMEQTGEPGADLFPPKPVVSLSSISKITAGKSHTCVLSATGDSWCWGRNDEGQLGIGYLSASAPPTPVKW